MSTKEFKDTGLDQIKKELTPETNGKFEKVIGVHHYTFWVHKGHLVQWKKRMAHSSWNPLK